MSANTMVVCDLPDGRYVSVAGEVIDDIEFADTYAAAPSSIPTRRVERHVCNAANAPTLASSGIEQIRPSGDDFDPYSPEAVYAIITIPGALNAISWR